MSCRRWGAIVVVVLTMSPLVVDAASRGASDLSTTILQTVRDHRRVLEASLPRREEEVRVASASLDRNSVLYARGLVAKEDLAAAARDVSEARAQLEATRSELLRTSTLIVEIEARRRLATLRSLRPGQYEATDAFVRYAGSRPFTSGEMLSLERYFMGRVGRTLPVSASGQTDFHTRLGLDHRHAVDVALHPDTAEGRVVMTWLREHGIPFLAFRAARSGAASGAHIHVGPPSERLSASR